MYIIGLKSWIYYTEELKLYLTRSGKLFGTVELDKEIESFSVKKHVCARYPTVIYEVRQMKKKKILQEFRFFRFLRCFCQYKRALFT